MRKILELDEETTKALALVLDAALKFSGEQIVNARNFVVGRIREEKKPEIE